MPGMAGDVRRSLRSEMGNIIGAEALRINSYNPIFSTKLTLPSIDILFVYVPMVFHCICTTFQNQTVSYQSQVGKLSSKKAYSW